MKEIGIVRNRITLMEHLEQLTHKDLQRLDISVLKAAVHACSQANAELPYALRLALAERSSCDVILKAQNESYDEKNSPRWLPTGCVWLLFGQGHRAR